MNVIFCTLNLAYCGYAVWLGANIYRTWKYDPVNYEHSFPFLFILVLCSLWPIIVPISYIQILRQRTDHLIRLSSDLGQLQ